MSPTSATNPHTVVIPLDLQELSLSHIRNLFQLFFNYPYQILQPSSVHFVILSKNCNSTLVASGVSWLPTLCSVLFTKIFSLFSPTALSFAFRHIRLIPSTPSLKISFGSGASLSSIIPLTASNFPRISFIFYYISLQNLLST